MADDSPLPTMGCFQTTDSVALQVVGQGPPGTRPCPVGPRNSGQFSAAARSLRASSTAPSATSRLVEELMAGPRWEADYLRFMFIKNSALVLVFASLVTSISIASGLFMSATARRIRLTRLYSSGSMR